MGQGASGEGAEGLLETIQEQAESLNRMTGKLLSLGWIGLLYIVFRSLGKQAGSSLGGMISRAPESVRKYLGLCLFSQAGVAIGLSIQTML